MPANRLAREKSPYLLQHAHNPVDWYPWGGEAFGKARAEDKPIFLSIGYSTCHWCHVMERESFKSEETAALLNRFFVPVKVDREERPDVDRIYMLFVQATTGGGGWPMSVFLTPDLKPFFGGTYFPPDNRYGRPGFPSILRSVAEAWSSDRPRILESGAAILEHLNRHTGISSGPESWRDDSLAERAFRGFQGEFDAEFGGFGGAPKFPRTVVHHFLLRYWSRTGNAEAAGMVFATLEAMARGGMHDQLGGGFHRYSVDERWFVPHFEKMLYDQALLAVSYLEAYQATGDEFHARVARSIFDYVLRDMISPEGAFYSAEDADSAPDPDQPRVKSEGAFYLWRKSEIDLVLGQPAAGWFCDLYGVRESGNVEFDPHGEFAGRNILYVAGSLGQVAELGDARRKLLEARSLRPRPHLDDKILTAWNALMISALARGAQVLGEPRLAEAARRAAGFVLSRLYDAPAGTLLRRFRDGDAAIGGFLDDYAFLAQALLDLYQTDFHPRWLEQALALTEKARELFEDASGGAFFGASAASDLVLRMKDDHDGAEPAANSIMVSNLLRLAEITGRDDLRQSAERALDAFAGRLKAAPAALPQLLAACLRAQAHPRQVVIAGDRQSADTEALVAEVRRRFLPDTLLLVVDQTSRAAIANWNPAAGRMHPMEGKAAAYVCENLACHEPVTEPGRLGKLLDSDSNFPQSTGEIMERPGATTLKGNPLTLIGPELKAGDKAPEFALVDTKLQPVNLANTGNKVRIFSVVPSLDTPVCDAQTKRFNDEAAKLANIDIYTVSVDLPFAQNRWCGAFGIDNVKMLSDHKDVSFGANYGTLIKELRIESRAIFVVDTNNVIRYAEYVKEVAAYPNYDAALAAAKSLA